MGQKKSSMTDSFKSEFNPESIQLLNTLIYVLANFKNGLIFSQEERQQSAQSKTIRNHHISPQDFDPVFTTRNKRHVHKTISTMMKAGQIALGPNKVSQLRQVARQKKQLSPQIEDDDIRDFLREGTRQKKVIIDRMRIKWESSIEERVVDNETSDPSFEDNEDTQEDSELKMKRQRDIANYQRQQQIAYLKLQEKTEGRRLKNQLYKQKHVVQSVQR